MGNRRGLFGQVQSVAVLCFGVLPLLWQHSAAWASALGQSDSEIIPSLFFLTVYMLIDSVVELPWSWYHAFVLEERHGFNRQVWARVCI